jgi:hypothetical protein
MVLNIIFWEVKYMELVGSFVKFEPILKGLVQILKIRAYQTSALNLCSPSSKTYVKVGSALDVVMGSGSGPL